jgi:hypothetical protein
MVKTLRELHGALRVVRNSLTINYPEPVELSGWLRLSARRGRSVTAGLYPAPVPGRAALS